ncbi:hypothetical protein [Streptomyces mirabilis]|uniref:hypothetical protein n=1 Tax=Streptomyces mirabilis TaxID=68239 RepID=UPI0036DA2A6F
MTAAFHRLSSVRLTAPQVEGIGTDVTVLDDGLADTVQALNAQRVEAWWPASPLWPSARPRTTRTAHPIVDWSTST